MRSSIETFLGVAAAGSLMFSLAACGPASNASTAPSSSSASAAAEMPKPLASIPALTGTSTAVKVDASFAEALKTLRLTPGVIGTAQLTDGSHAFPITGGKVDYYAPQGLPPLRPGPDQPRRLRLLPDLRGHQG